MDNNYLAKIEASIRAIIEQRCDSFTEEDIASLQQAVSASKIMLIREMLIKQAEETYNIEEELKQFQKMLKEQLKEIGRLNEDSSVAFSTVKENFSKSEQRNREANILTWQKRCEELLKITENTGSFIEYLCDECFEEDGLKAAKDIYMSLLFRYKEVANSLGVKLKVNGENVIEGVTKARVSVDTKKLKAFFEQIHSVEENLNFDEHKQYIESLEKEQKLIKQKEQKEKEKEEIEEIEASSELIKDVCSIIFSSEVSRVRCEQIEEEISQMDKRGVWQKIKDFLNRVDINEAKENLGRKKKESIYSNERVQARKEELKEQNKLAVKLFELVEKKMEDEEIRKEVEELAMQEYSEIPKQGGKLEIVINMIVQNALKERKKEVSLTNEEEIDIKTIRFKNSLLEEQITEKLGEEISQEEMENIFKIRSLTPEGKGETLYAIQLALETFLYNDAIGLNEEEYGDYRNMLNSMHSCIDSLLKHVRKQMGELDETLQI